MKLQFSETTTIQKSMFLIIAILLLIIVLFEVNHLKIDIPIKTITSDELDKQELKNTLIAMWDAIEKNDLESYSKNVHPDFTQFGETDSILKVGKEVEINGIRNWLKNSSNIHTEMIDPIVTLRGDVAWITYYWSDNGITNNEAFSSKGKSTRIFVKENGGWLCIHGHFTLLP